MGATPETVAEYAAKHGISEEAVRDIAGLPDGVDVSVEAKQDGKNPAIVSLKGSHDLRVDWGDSTEWEQHGKTAKHRYHTPGSYRARVEVGGEVRWVDIEAGVDADPETVEPVFVAPPIGAPDFDGVNVGKDNAGNLLPEGEIDGQVTVEEAVAEVEAQPV